MPIGKRGFSLYARPINPALLDRLNPCAVNERTQFTKSAREIRPKETNTCARVNFLSPCFCCAAVTHPSPHPSLDLLLPAVHKFLLLVNNRPRFDSLPPFLRVRISLGVYISSRIKVHERARATRVVNIDVRFFFSFFSFIWILRRVNFQGLLATFASDC